MQGMDSLPTEGVVRYGTHEGVATITLHRPDRLNAWNRQMSAAFADALDTAERDHETRAIVLTGAGRGFCAGADLDVLNQRGGGANVVGDDPRAQPARLLSIAKPVIGAVNGGAAGLGFVLAMMCDVRFAAAGAKLTAAFSRRGLIAEYGISWMLPRLVGPARALDLLLSSRVVIAEDALTLGLVNAVVPPDQVLERAQAYAADLAANCSPSSLAVIKRQVLDHLDAPLSDALEESQELMEASLDGPDAKEGVASYLERRAPRFAPPRHG
ncbi:MAG: enoyl-CoA hydratase-related protein [Candidatus Dormiibacterota bacterium]